MRYVIAVGGNALENSKVLNKLSASIAWLHKHGNEIVMTHGNGPQVGALALHNHGNLALLTRKTEAQVGSMIRKSLVRADKKTGSEAEIVYTHVLVDEGDAEFARPTKPIGKFYSKTQAEELAKRGFVMKRLLKGYRRVVPSPKPRRIVEMREIERLLKLGNIVIAAGGGGMAITNDGARPRYADAVIDKDLASSLLAEKIHADRLIILTDVDGIFVGFHTKKARLLKHVSIAVLRRYVATEHFESGSILPKVEACINFVKKTRNKAVVMNLNKANRVFKLTGATVISP